MALLFGYSSGLSTIEEDIDMNGNRIIDHHQLQIRNLLRKVMAICIILEEVVDAVRGVQRVTKVLVDAGLQGPKNYR